MDKINRIGEEHITNEGYKVTIIEFLNSYNCSIKFEDGSILNNIQYNNLKLGNIKNRNHKTIYGVGYLGNGEFLRKHNRESYRLWVKILKQCYDKDYQTKFITHINDTVCNEWYNFQNFTKWFNNQNYKIGYYLVQNILDSNNTEFNPENSVFIPLEIERLFNQDYISKSLYPEGVTYNISTNNYIAYFKGTIGYFLDKDVAYLAYKNYKEAKIKKIVEKYKNSIREDVYTTLIEFKISY